MIWNKKATGYVSALTFANLVYVMRKELDAKEIEDNSTYFYVIYYA